MAREFFIDLLILLIVCKQPHVWMRKEEKIFLEKHVLR